MQTDWQAGRQRNWIKTHPFHTNSDFPPPLSFLIHSALSDALGIFSLSLFFFPQKTCREERSCGRRRRRRRRRREEETLPLRRRQEREEAGKVVRGAERALGEGVEHMGGRKERISSARLKDFCINKHTL